MAAAVASPEIPARAPTPPHHLSLDTSVCPVPFPKRHIPYSSPGPAQASLIFGLDGTISPPASPPTTSEPKDEAVSVLHPPIAHDKINQDPPVFAISASTLVESLEHTSSRPLPDPDLVFPWFHGLHPDNHMQLSFFMARRKASRGVPKCLRGTTIVKAGGDLSFAKLKGAITPQELLGQSHIPGERAAFNEVDPRVGFSVRNFHIQTCKMATVSDVVVYGDDTTSKHEVEELAKIFSAAQIAWRKKIGTEAGEEFHTFVVSDPFSTFESRHPEVVAVDSSGGLTGSVMDFFHQERIEMHDLTKASEIGRNVWLGPSPDNNLSIDDITSGDEQHFDLLIEGNDFARMPDAQSLEGVEQFLNENEPGCCVAYLDFPASGSISISTCTQYDVDRLVASCRFIYDLANHGASDKSGDGDEHMHDDATPQRRILIHCADGYTETTLLAIAYTMFAENIPAHEAWKRLHTERERNFFAYASDKAFLEGVEKRLLEASPAKRSADVSLTSPDWMQRMDGSFPSRILPYLYLGNLNHANNPALLKELGIGRVLSVGEPINWTDDDPASWGESNFLFIDRVQDNGVDPLTHEFDHCLDFIQQGRDKGMATLVHCRVGVSRSATICLAEVMKELGYSFPRAYCFVRARRLNVIIQPHLRFVYELLKWEELQGEKRGQLKRRELEWATVAREIALMNKPYTRQ